MIPRFGFTNILCVLFALSVPVMAALVPAPQRAPDGWSPPPRIVVPQIGRAVGARSSIEVDRILARVAIDDRVAVTTLEISVRNRSSIAQEASLLVPMPVGAVVTGFTFEGTASEPTARLLERGEARREYDAIVARERDPALLEWAGWNMLRSSVFPVPAGGAQRMRITWEELLEPQGDRLDYLLPRSDIERGTKWRMEVAVRSSIPLAAIYSPTHELRMVRRTDRSAELLLDERTGVAAGALRLSLVRTAEPTATVVTYPDPAIGGGYFLLLTAAPPVGETKPLPRDVILVLDRSGSMAGRPIEEAKAAALAIVGALRDGERVNIVDFSNGVSSFAPAPVALDAATRAALASYIASLRAGGGTNIHDALLEALRQPAAEGAFPACLFLTDGLPTIGRTREGDIRALVERSGSERRLFTVGLGPDVNVPLLDRIADLSRADATYVGQGEELSGRLTGIAERLSGPVLADLNVVHQRIGDLAPHRIPDLFRGSNLVLLGRYRGEEPFTLRVAGRGAQGERSIDVLVDPGKASVSHAYVPRLWASRRIAELIDAVRALGEDLPGGRLPSESDPRLRELMQEILRLSTTFGILTEYTSMLDLEGSRLDDWKSLEVACNDLLRGRAVRSRSGAEVINQGVNWNRQKLEWNAGATRSYLDAAGNSVRAGNLVQCADNNYWRSGDVWTDARLIGAASPQPEETILLGSDAHRRLVDELVEEGRQSSIALDGDLLIVHRGRTLLVRNRP